MTDNTLVYFGGEVKALEETDDAMKVGGHVILWGDKSTPDLSATKDYFTKSTDLGLDVATKGRVRWHHGLDPAIGRAVLGLVDFKADQDDVGQWAEGWISKRTAYEKKVAGWIAERKVGFSTGTASHCVGRKNVGRAREITEWPLGSDVSLTLTPADPRQASGVLSLKSLLKSTDEAASASFVEILNRAASVLSFSRGRNDLTASKREAIKGLRSCLNLYRDSVIDPEKIRACSADVDELLTRFKV